MVTLAILYLLFRSTFPIIDEKGCPVDPTIFPRFTPEDSALISKYEAFRCVKIANGNKVKIAAK